MAGRFSFLLCTLLISVSVSTSSDEGKWFDDVTGNAQVMGTQSDDDTQVFVPVAPVAVVHSDGDGHDHQHDGSWVDDVTGNLVVMGEDSDSQDTGLNS
jgi:hypothetical protein